MKQHGVISFSNYNLAIDASALLHPSYHREGPCGISIIHALRCRRSRSYGPHQGPAHVKQAHDGFSRHLQLRHWCRSLACDFMLSLPAVVVAVTTESPSYCSSRTSTRCFKRAASISGCRREEAKAVITSAVVGRSVEAHLWYCALGPRAHLASPRSTQVTLWPARHVERLSYVRASRLCL